MTAVIQIQIVFFFFIKLSFLLWKLVKNRSSYINQTELIQRLDSPSKLDLCISVYCQMFVQLYSWSGWIWNVPIQFLSSRRRRNFFKVHLNNNLSIITSITYHLCKKKRILFNWVWLLFPSPDLKNKVIFGIYKKTEQIWLFFKVPQWIF